MPIFEKLATLTSYSIISTVTHRCTDIIKIDLVDKYCLFIYTYHAMCLILSWNTHAHLTPASPGFLARDGGGVACGIQTGVSRPHIIMKMTVLANSVLLTYGLLLISLYLQLSLFLQAMTVNRNWLGPRCFRDRIFY